MQQHTVFHHPSLRAPATARPSCAQPLRPCSGRCGHAAAAVAMQQHSRPTPAPPGVHGWVLIASHPVTSPVPPAHYQHYHTSRDAHAAFHQRTQQSNTLHASHTPFARNPAALHQHPAALCSRNPSTRTPVKKKKLNNQGKKT